MCVECLMMVVAVLAAAEPSCHGCAPSFSSCPSQRVFCCKCRMLGRCAQVEGGRQAACLPACGNPQRPVKPGKDR